MIHIALGCHLTLNIKDSPLSIQPSITQRKLYGPWSFISLVHYNTWLGRQTERTTHRGGWEVRLKLTDQPNNGQET